MYQLITTNYIPLYEIHIHVLLKCAPISNTQEWFQKVDYIFNTEIIK